MENYAGIQIGCFSFRCSRIKPGAEKDQPAYAFLVSVCAVGGVLVIVIQQIRPVMEWLQALAGAFPAKRFPACCGFWALQLLRS